MQYQTYDVTALLTGGTNCIGVLLGDGWYKGRFGFDGGASNLFGDRTGIHRRTHRELCGWNHFLHSFGSFLAIRPFAVHILLHL